MSDTLIATRERDAAAPEDRPVLPTVLRPECEDLFENPIARRKPSYGRGILICVRGISCAQEHKHGY